MASNDNNGKRKVEQTESSAVSKRIQLFEDDGGDDSSGESEETMEEEVSSKESSMNQLDTSEEKLMAKHEHDLLFNDDGDTSPESEPRTPKRRSTARALTPTAVMMTMTKTSGFRLIQKYLVIVVSL
jgi:hypothetical protein